MEASGQEEEGVRASGKGVRGAPNWRDHHIGVQHRMNVTDPGKTGCESLLELHIEEATTHACFCPCQLDSTGQRTIQRYTGYEAVHARLSAKWKSRGSPAEYKRVKPKRWRTVVSYAKDMRKGDAFPPSVFLSPNLTGKPTYDLLDGARRIMASVESGASELICIVLRKTRHHA